MKIVLKLLALAVPLTFATGCVVHERRTVHYPPPPPQPQPRVVIVEQPPPAPPPRVVVIEQPAPPPEPRVVIVRPPPPPPEPKVVVVKLPPPAPEPKVVIVKPPPPAPEPKVIVVKQPPPAPQQEVVVVSPPPASRPQVVTTHARERSVPTPAPETRPAKEPWVNVTISAQERQVIREYVVDHSDDDHPGKKGHKGKSLPPGLAKKAARGENLPPGWEKRVVRGQTMPTEVYRQCQPLPVEVTTRLPAPPAGTILVTIEGKVVRLAQATLEILDVFDVF